MVRPSLVHIPLGVSVETTILEAVDAAFNWNRKADNALITALDLEHFLLLRVVNKLKEKRALESVKP
jgi:hypothetical protein